MTEIQNPTHSKQDKSSSVPFRVLVVDDNVLYAQAIGKKLKHSGLGIDLAYTAREALDLSRVGRYQVILLDHKLPDDDGIRIIPILMSRQQHCSLVMMTAYGEIKNAISALRQGAEDYILKETSIEPIVQRVLELYHRNILRSSEDGWDEHKNNGLIGQSPAMTKVRNQIEKVASQKDTTVLFTGETGVGKEIAARYLHCISVPAKSPFVSVDCVALPATLVESLLFGHEKGAFTGAHESKDGIFQEAKGGTVLLDEIGDMDLTLQGKLLRVLETRSFQKIGSVQEHAVMARVVAATNRDLVELVQEGSFRFDLFQRLSVFPITIPPLRDRGDDILLAAYHFVEFFSSKMKKQLEPLSPEIQDRLMEYDYPGNVRELKNIIERAVIMTDSPRIDPKHLPERMLDNQPKSKDSFPEAKYHSIGFIPGVDTIETFEKKMIHHALKQTNGAKTEAAKMLGISRYQLHRRMQKYDSE
ncbi:MAG: sigma-54-dependent Fis family transcriptional regulator [Proteobacteria bacterium]|nr:sigma-54-dependent Fis family transcriptional regulator [Pseudomonadota bacterium]